MSPSETPSSPIPAPRSPDSALFMAFQERKPLSWRVWALIVVIPVLIGLGAWGVMLSDRATYRLVTPHGIKALHTGMSLEEGLAVMGAPLAVEHDVNGADCHRYGQPNFAQEKFTIYSVCYADGKLRDVTLRHFSAWKVDPDTGTFAAPGPAAPVQPVQ